MTKKTTRFSWSGVTPQLFLVVVLPLTILLLLTTFGGLRLHQLSMRSLVGERDERAVRAAANALTEQISHRISVIHSLALRIQQDSGAIDPVEVAAEMNYFSKDFDQGLAVYNSQLELLYFVGDESFWNNLDLKSFRPTDLATDEAGTVGIDSFTKTFNSKPVVLMISEERDDSHISAGAFSPANSIEFVLSDVFKPSDGGYAFVVDHNRQLLYQMGNQTDPMESLPDHIGISEALDGKAGSTYLEFGGVEHVVAYSSVEPLGWALVIEEPWDVVASPLLRLTEYAPLVLIPILLLTLLALWFGTSRIVHPLHQLEERASALGWGDFNSIEIPVGGIAEIRDLQNELIQLSKKVKAGQQGLRGYIRVMTRGLEEERHNLARELHDDTLQSLIALNQRIQLARLSANGTTDEQSLDEIQKLIENTIQDLRRTARALRPIYLEDLGLSAALEMLARETQQIHGLEIRFQRNGIEQRLTDEIELALYRMVQESLSNVARHADAENVMVGISFTTSLITVQVMDDGQGFDLPDSPSAFAPSGHYGLLGMYERAELIGAKLAINSEPGKGTRIVISLPIVKQVFLDTQQS